SAGHAGRARARRLDRERRRGLPHPRAGRAAGARRAVSIVFAEAPPAVASLAAADVVAHPYRPLGTFRFVLATLVLVSHASGFLPELIGGLSLGNVGVLLFFVVSGF